MTLEGEATLFKHGKAQTLYISIPAAIVKDSSFTLQTGQKVRIEWDPGIKELYVWADGDPHPKAGKPVILTTRVKRENTNESRR